MNSFRWNIAVLTLVTGIVAATVAVNYHVNFYGLFGDCSGKKYVVYDNERTTKYLFSYNYIPRNFDALLIGSSSSANWNTGELSGMRMYNASINGGNITEEALVADRILEEAPPKLALFLIHPYLTETYGRKSGFMNPQEYWGALGSLQLFRGYWRKWQIEHGYARQEFNEFGSDDFIVPQPVAAEPQSQVQGQTTFLVDPRAIQEYGDLLERVRSRHIRIVAVTPPVEMKHWKAMRVEFAGYCSKIRALFRTDEPLIDLNGMELDGFRESQGNYQDEVHLSSLGARRIVQVINRRLEQMGLLGRDRAHR